MPTHIMKMPTTMSKYLPMLRKSISPLAATKTTATTSRPEEWPSPQRTPIHTAVQEDPTLRVARALRWSGPAMTWSSPMLSPASNSVSAFMPVSCQVPPHASSCTSDSQLITHPPSCDLSHSRLVARDWDCGGAGSVVCGLLCPSPSQSTPQVPYFCCILLPPTEDAPTLSFAHALLLYLICSTAVVKESCMWATLMPMLTTNISS